jgi:hypothetical protein
MTTKSQTWNSVIGFVIRKGRGSIATLKRGQDELTPNKQISEQTGTYL